MADYVQRRLLSRPDVVVTVPKEYDEKAKRLIAVALYKPDGVIDFFAKNLDLAEAHVYIDVGGIIATRNKPGKNAIVRDVVYLTIVKYGVSKLESSTDPAERKKAQEIRPELEKLYDEIDKSIVGF